MRVLVEVIEHPTSLKVTDSYFLTDRDAANAFINTEQHALNSVAMPGEANKLTLALTKFWNQCERGMLAKGDDLMLTLRTTRALFGDNRIQYCITAMDPKHS